MNQFLKKYIDKIVLIFLILSPFFDLMSSIFINVFKINFNFIILFKLFFLFILIYYLFFISTYSKKRSCIYYLLVLFLYSVIYMIIQIYYKDWSIFLYEAQNLFRTIYFPVCLVCLFAVYKEKKFNIDKSLLSKILIIYLVLIFIPLITHTGFNSYAYSKVGSIGWFNSTNEIGGILSILFPFLILCLFEFKNKLISIIIFLSLFFIYFSLGSKVPVIAFVLITILYLFRYVITLFINKKYKILSFIMVILIVIITAFVLILPKTAFYKNIVIHLDFLEVKQVSDLFSIEKIDHFVFSSRINFMEKTMSNYKDSTLSQQLFGIGYIENYGTDSVNIKTIEMDYYDVLFRNGIIGFIIIFAPFIKILILIYPQLIKKDELSFAIRWSTILIILLSLFSGHILTSPSVSLFVVVILLSASFKLNCEIENDIILKRK